MTEQNRTEIKAIVPDVRFSEPMSAHTTFKIGGAADVYAEVSTPQEAAALIAYCREHDIPYIVMGNGSNMLVSDAGFDGAVIAVRRNMCAVTVDGTRITAAAGALLSAVASAAAKAELAGLEFASGIPGTVGGGVFMNAGAYGGELKQIIRTVTYMDENGTEYTEDVSKLDMSYRHSKFSNGGYVILSAIFELEHGSAEEIYARMRDYSERRSSKQPLTEPSAGSTFKRPEGYFAGKLIQDCGLMGYRIGGAAVSEKHAGFIVNKGGATCADVTALIKYVQDKVKERFGVELEPEVRIIGYNQREK